MKGIFAAAAAVITAAAAASNLKLTAENFRVISGRLPEQADGLKILHLSDLHKKKFGKNYHRLLNKIPDEKYDAVCFTGDLISRSERQFSQKIDFMKRLSRFGPTFFIAGNHELDAGKYGEMLMKELQNAGIAVLRNSRSEITKNGVKLDIFGYEGEKRFFVNENGSHLKLPKITLSDLQRSLPAKTDRFTVLLAHSPFGFDAYSQWGADLSLCGHVHGGAVRIPFTNVGVLSPERKFFPKYSSGLYEKNGKAMVVSTGIGKLRLFTCSSITVVTVRSKNPGGV